MHALELAYYSVQYLACDCMVLAQVLGIGLGNRSDDLEHCDDKRMAVWIHIGRMGTHRPYDSVCYNSIETIFENKKDINMNTKKIDMKRFLMLTGALMCMLFVSESAWGTYYQYAALTASVNESGDGEGTVYAALSVEDEENETLEESPNDPSSHNASSTATSPDGASKFFQFLLMQQLHVVLCSQLGNL